MKALITGASGFVGGHLTTYLATHSDLELFGTTLDDISQLPDNVSWWKFDLRDFDHVHDMLSKIRPDMIFHLAGQAFVPASFEDPWGTLENNIKSQLNIQESLLKLEHNCRLLVISSAHIYGKINPNENPVNESQPFRPDNPYSVSKVAQDMLALQYFLTHDMYIVRARPFNHIGPGQNTRFALPNFAEQIASAETGDANPVIYVGNLEAERDFTDVRDVVQAYYLMLREGHVGEAYNVCSGEAHTMHNLLENMCNLSTTSLTIEIDESRLRPLDVPRVVGDSSKLRQDTGWEPTIGIQQSLADILAHSRTIRAAT